MFRPSSPADADAIRDLCDRVLSVPEGSPVLSPAHMRWKYWRTWPDWTGSRSFVVTKGDRVVAHAGVVPLHISRHGRRYTLLQPLDWAADSSEVGAGVLLLLRLGRLANGLVSVRGSQMTRRILVPLGFVPMGEIPRYAALLSESAPVLTQVAMACTVRMYERGLDHAAPHPLQAVASTADRIVSQRSLAQLEAFMACPAAAMEYGEVWHDDALLGTFLLCQTPGQLRWVDAWADPQRPGSFAVLTEHVMRQASTRSAVEIVCQTNDPEQERALRAAGFRPAGADPLSILADPNIIPPGATFRHQLIDSDLAYLHHGVAESWLD